MGKNVRVRESSPYLPHEVIFFNILNRVPVETLLRFSSVSKLWDKTIHDHQFVRSLLSQERENNISSMVALFKVKTGGRGFDYHFVHKGLEFFCIHTKNCTYRVGDCNGLFCFRSISGFEICNPTTQEFLYHPFPPSPPPRCLRSYGFGFDPLENNYKIVQIVNGNGSYARCMVYTLGADLWKDITVKSNLPNCLSHNSFTGLDGPAGMVNPDTGLYLSGALYWYFRRDNMVIRFDLHNEIFSLIRVGFLCPYDSMHSYGCFLTEWQGSLCLAFRTPRGRSVLMYKYMLKEHSLPEFGPQHEGAQPAVVVWERIIVELPRAPFSRVSVLGGESTMLYWFTAQARLSFYSPNISSSFIWDSGSETVVKYSLPVGVKRPSICEYKFFHHMENSLCLKNFVAQVKSVSSL